MQKKVGVKIAKKVEKNGRATMILPVQKTKKIAKYSLHGHFCLARPKKKHCTFSPVVFAEDISCSAFAARRLLYAAPFMLLATCYSLLPLCCLQPDYCLVLASLWLDPFFLVARPSPFTAHCLNACYMPLAITFWLLTTQFSLFSVFDSSQDQSPRAPRG